jgi:hypothetical protein
MPAGGRYRRKDRTAEVWQIRAVLLFLTGRSAAREMYGEVW